jgi:hypothetical protein
VAASMMDQELMLAYAALGGTEDAAVDAAGKLTGWLVEQCVKLTQEHATITAEHKERILAALHACRQASIERNRLPHDAPPRYQDWQAADVRLPRLRPGKPLTPQEAAAIIGACSPERYSSVRTTSSWITEAPGPMVA